MQFENVENERRLVVIRVQHGRRYPDLAQNISYFTTEHQRAQDRVPPHISRQCEGTVHQLDRGVNRGGMTYFANAIRQQHLCI